MEEIEEIEEIMDESELLKPDFSKYKVVNGVITDQNQLQEKMQTDLQDMINSVFNYYPTYGSSDVWVPIWVVKTTQYNIVRLGLFKSGYGDYSDRYKSGVCPENVEVDTRTMMERIYQVSPELTQSMLNDATTEEFTKLYTRLYDDYTTVDYADSKRVHNIRNERYSAIYTNVYIKLRY